MLISNLSYDVVMSHISALLKESGWRQQSRWWCLVP